MAEHVEQTDVAVVAVPPPAFTTKRIRRRRKIFDDETLVDAVLAVGFEKLTIEAVAGHLDVAHSALYHHVKDRDALVQLAMDHLMRRQMWPSAGPDWRRYLDENGRVVWAMLEAHPGLSLELTAQTARGAAIEARMQSMNAHLEMLGFTPENANLAVDFVIDLAFDVAIRSHYYFIRSPPVAGDEPNTWYFQKLEVALDGIAARLAPPPSRRARTASLAAADCSL